MAIVGRPRGKASNRRPAAELVDPPGGMEQRDLCGGVKCERNDKAVQEDQLWRCDMLESKRRTRRGALLAWGSLLSGLLAVAPLAGQSNNAHATLKDAQGRTVGRTTPLNTGL